MPLIGELDVTAALADAPTLTTLAPEPWHMPGARVLQLNYEVDAAPALTVTPPACHPSNPPYATVSFIHCPESPAGGFSLAMVRLIVRAGIRPRGILIQGFIDNPLAADGLAAWGYRLQLADVRLTRRHNQLEGTVKIDGETALHATLSDPEPVAPTDLELFDNLHLVNVAGDDPVIVQVDPTYTYTSGDRGIPKLVVYNKALLGTEAIEPVHPQVAVCCEGDIDLLAPRFVMDPITIAYEGTRRLESA